MIFNAILAFIALKRRLLSKTGVLIAYILGSWIYYSDFEMYVVILCFFLIVSINEFLLSSRIEHEKRSGEQVMCVGVIPAIVLVVGQFGEKDYSMIFTALMASNLADTMASSIGNAYSKKVYSIISFKPVERGQSGGVSMIGTSAAFFASFIMSILYMGLNLQYSIEKNIFRGTIIFLTGILGMLIDSLLGAVIQKKYICVSCGKIVENQYCCNQKAKKISSLKCLSNCQVNLVTNIVLFFLLISFC